jgi:hypothetical protein
MTLLVHLLYKAAARLLLSYLEILNLKKGGKQIEICSPPLRSNASSEAISAFGLGSKHFPWLSKQCCEWSQSVRFEPP